MKIQLIVATILSPLLLKRRKNLLAFVAPVVDYRSLVEPQIESELPLLKTLVVRANVY